MKTYLVANHILRYLDRKTVKKINTQTLVQMIYHIHGWHLAITGNPLIDDEFYSGAGRPSLQTLEDCTRKYGDGIITTYIEGLNARGTVTLFDKEDEEMKKFFYPILEKVVEYFNIVQSKKIDRTMKTVESPYGMTRPRDKISNNLIRQQFIKMGLTNAGYTKLNCKFISAPIIHEHILPRQEP